MKPISQYLLLIALIPSTLLSACPSIYYTITNSNGVVNKYTTRLMVYKLNDSGEPSPGGRIYTEFCYNFTHYNNGGETEQVAQFSLYDSEAFYELGKYIKGSYRGRSYNESKWNCVKNTPFNKYIDLSFNVMRGADIYQIKFIGKFIKKIRGVYESFCNMGY
jgi:hypothetical protein